MKICKFGLLVFGACAGVARGDTLLPCTGATLTIQVQQDTNCVVANPGGAIVVTSSYENDPTSVNTPVSATVNQYQTTLTAILNGGTTVFSQTLAAPFSDPSVQSAILAADAVLTSDGATFGSPLLDSTSTTLQSSVLTYVPTSPTLDIPTLISCYYAGSISTDPFTCAGVTVTLSAAVTSTFGPATIMIGPAYSDVFYVEADQEDLSVNEDYVYTVDQNAVTTNTYLTTQSYEIDGTTASTSAPEPGTWGTCAMSLAGIAGIWLVRRAGPRPARFSA